MKNLTLITLLVLGISSCHPNLNGTEGQVYSIEQNASGCECTLYFSEGEDDVKWIDIPCSDTVKAGDVVRLVISDK